MLTNVKNSNEIFYFKGKMIRCVGVQRSEVRGVKSAIVEDC